MKYFSLFQIAQAAPVIAPAGSISNTDSSQSLSSTITTIASNIIQVLLVIGGIFAVLYLIWAGYQYITSGGNSDKTKTARTGIIHVILGIIIIMAAYFIVRFATSLGREAACSDLTGQELVNCRQDPLKKNPTLGSSNHPPVVKIQAQPSDEDPFLGQTYSLMAPLSLSLESSDPDNDPLTVKAWYKAPNGEPKNLEGATITTSKLTWQPPVTYTDCGENSCKILSLGSGEVIAPGPYELWIEVKDKSGTTGRTRSLFNVE